MESRVVFACLYKVIASDSGSGSGTDDEEASVMGTDKVVEGVSVIWNDNADDHQTASHDRDHLVSVRTSFDCHSGLLTLIEIRVHVSGRHLVNVSVTGYTNHNASLDVFGTPHRVIVTVIVNGSVPALVQMRLP